MYPLPYDISLISVHHADMASSDILTRHYYADTKAVIFVYDITRAETLFEAESWIRDLKLYLNEELLKGLPILFVGNKVDKMMHQEDQFLKLEDEDKSQEEFVTLQQAKGYTQKEGFLDALECSAKTGVGVANIFQRIASVLAGQNDDKKLRWCNIF